MGKKCLVFVLALMFVFCGLAYAEQTGGPDGNPIWSTGILQHSHGYTDNDSYVDKYSEYQKKQNWPMGVGVDAIIYEFEPSLYDYGMETINVESKYDIANSSMSVFGVVHVNLWQAGKKLFNKE
jgi:hypothetical protein